MEIERQFLITDLPPLPPTYDLLRQGYVALLPEIRIRQIALNLQRGLEVVTEDARFSYETLAR